MWHIPFPAVTICPETKARQSKFNFTDTYLHLLRSETPTEEEMFKLGIVGQVCNAYIFDNRSQGEKIITHESIDQLLNMSVEFVNTMITCEYQRKMYPCDKLFAPIITEDGVCYTFNALSGRQIYRNDTMSNDFFYYEPFKADADAWTLESGYTSSNYSVYPSRVLPSETHGGLRLLLALNASEIDPKCRGNLQGFKVLLHSPDELPRVSKHYAHVPLSNVVTLRVNPKMMQTADALKKHSPDRRQCFFNHERHLKFFQIYTQFHCELECLTNLTLSKCGCVKFSMPRDKSMPICGFGQWQCLLDAKINVLKEKIDQELSHNLDQYSQKCNCLPACTSIQYDFVKLEARYHWEDLFKVHGTEQYPGYRFSLFDVIFQEEEFTTSKRSEIYGFIDFLANSGGLMGLFMGVSLFSIVEIFYFCICRLFCNLKVKSTSNGKVPDQH